MNIQNANDAGTGVVAATAIASPLWLDTVQQVSTFAEWALPILGAVWLVVQIAWKVREMRYARKDRNPDSEG